MGKDVEKIKKLLSQGYQISEYAISANKIMGTKDQFEQTFSISIARGDVKQEIISKEDDDIFEFMLHFIKIKDQFDNYHFVYVDDYKKYRSIDQDNLPPSFVDKHEIWIGSRKFDQGIFLMSLMHPKSGKDICEFFIDYEKNPILNDIDLKDAVKVIEKESKKNVFGGYVDHSSRSHNSQFFACEGGTKYFSHTKTAFTSSNISSFELADFIARCAGQTIKFDDSIKPKLDVRDFVLIMPIGNLALQENITIANTTIYHKLDSVEDHLIRIQDFAYQDLDWNGNNLRIRTKISADNYFDAIMKGYQKISTVIDCIAFRSDFSYPNYKQNKQIHDVLFSCYRHFSRIKVHPKIFCKQIGSNGHIIFNLKTITENKLVFDYGAKDFFNLVNALFEKLLLKDKNTLNQNERSVLSSCHWLRLGIFADDRIERLIYLYNSLEFAISGISPTKQFSASDLELIREKIQGLSLSDTQLNKIKIRINDLNSSSLLEKLEFSCKEYDISVEDGEWELIRSIRTKRNDIIHGKKDVMVTQEELEKLRTIIEKILLEKMNKIYS
ncbi:hypothetical protein K0U27_06830 [archaeon]|nr:hypothetical protein [archaeon]